MIFMLYQELIDNAQEWGLFDVETSLWEQVEDTSTTEKVQEKKAKTRTAKPQLSKTQKRNAAKHDVHVGQKPRGWNWIDIISHLSKRGAPEVAAK